MSEGLVALFIDYENISRSVEEQLNEPLRLQKILEAAERYGRVIIRRAYADWSTCQQQRELYTLGIEQVHVGGRSKNASDIRLTIDVVSTVATGTPPLTHIVLVSGDGDFTELVHFLHRYGKFVVGIGVRNTSAASLIAACDEFIYYEDLREKGPPPSEHDEVSRYIKALSPKVRMSSNPHRPWVILEVHKLMRQNPGLSLNALGEKLREYYQQRHPEVPQGVVTEVVHQLFHTYCFDFNPPYGQEGPPLWDRPAFLKEGIRSGGDLLEHCDLGLLRIIYRNLKEPLNPEPAARLLYGRSDDSRLMEYIQGLIKKLEQE